MFVRPCAAPAARAPSDARTPPPNAPRPGLLARDRSTHHTTVTTRGHRCWPADRSDHPSEPGVPTRPPGPSPISRPAPGFPGDRNPPPTPHLGSAPTAERRYRHLPTPAPKPTSQPDPPAPPHAPDPAADLAPATTPHRP